MRLSLFLFDLPLDQYATVARAADALNFEALWVSDHLVAPIDFAPKYPYRATGRPSFLPSTPYPDAFVLFGQLAAVTRRVLLGVGVFILPLRNPFVVAKAAATAQALSNGRVLLGVGVGWMREEFEALGERFSWRGRRTEEMIEVMKKLWTGEPVQHAGACYRFAKLQMSPGLPAPIPCLVGGSSEAALLRAARIADGWAGPPAELEANLACRARLLEALEANGRDPARFALWPRPNRAATRELVSAYRDAGFERLIIQVPRDMCEKERRGFLEQAAQWAR